MQDNPLADINLRCKLFQMDSSEEWHCLGIGYADILSKTGQPVQVVFYEEDSHALTYSQTVDPSFIYERQESNIICWYSMQTNEPEMAFSFQNVKGSEVIWKQLKNVNDSRSLNLKIVDEKEEPMDVYEEFSPLQDIAKPSPHCLQPTMANLKEFEDDLQGKVGLHTLVANNTLDSLKKIFYQLEKESQSPDKEQKENFDSASSACGLQSMFRIMRSIVSLAEQDLLEYLLSDHYHLFLFSCLECTTFLSILDDLEIQSKRPVSHRQFFQESVKFHQIASIEDPEVIRTIHLTYRLQYLKDCILGHYLNERTLGIITIMVHNNYIEVIRHIQSRKSVMSSIMEQLRNKSLMALRMVNEICMLLKGLEVLLLRTNPRSTAKSTKKSSTRVSTSTPSSRSWRKSCSQPRNRPNSCL